MYYNQPKLCYPSFPRPGIAFLVSPQTLPALQHVAQIANGASRWLVLCRNNRQDCASEHRDIDQGNRASGELETFGLLNRFNFRVHHGYGACATNTDM